MLLFLLKLLCFSIVNFDVIVVNSEANLTDLSFDLNTHSIALDGSLQFRHVKKIVGATSDGSWLIKTINYCAHIIFYLNF